MCRVAADAPKLATCHLPLADCYLLKLAHALARALALALAHLLLAAGDLQVFFAGLAEAQWYDPTEWAFCI